MELESIESKWIYINSISMLKKINHQENYKRPNAEKIIQKILEGEI